MHSGASERALVSMSCVPTRVSRTCCSRSPGWRDITDVPMCMTSRICPWADVDVDGRDITDLLRGIAWCLGFSTTLSIPDVRSQYFRPIIGDEPLGALDLCPEVLQFFLPPLGWRTGLRNLHDHSKYP